MTSLTDRYVHATVRGLDEGQRPDVEQELRGTIEDMVDARVESGAVSREAAERDVLVELGDPMRLAAGYSGSPLHLIGPAYFPQWRRLVTLLLSIVVPIVALVTLVVRLFVDDVAADGVGAAFGGAAVVALHTSVHIVFWTTLVFALLERSDSADVGEWDPDQLPDDDAARSVGRGETVTSVVMLVLVGLALVWQQTSSPVESGGVRVPVLDPDLWSGWLPALLVAVVAQVVLVLLVHRAGRWTVPYALTGAAIDAAATALTLWLLHTDRLFDGRFLDALVDGGWTDASRDLTVATTLGIVVIVLWDQVDTLRRALRGRRQA